MRIKIENKYKKIYSDTKRRSNTPQISKFIEKFNKFKRFHAKENLILAEKEPDVLEFIYNESTYEPIYLDLFNNEFMIETGVQFAQGILESDYKFFYYKILVSNENCPDHVLKQIYKSIRERATSSFFENIDESAADWYKSIINHIYSKLCKNENTNSSMLFEMFKYFLHADYNINNNLNNLLFCINKNFSNPTEAFYEIENAPNVTEHAKEELLLEIIYYSSNVTSELVEEIFQKYYQKSFYIAKALLLNDKLSTESKLKIIDFFVENYKNSISYKYRYIEAFDQYFKESDNVPPEIVKKFWDSEDKDIRGIIPEDLALEVIFNKDSSFSKYK
jgi:hypothetical protein